MWFDWIKTSVGIGKNTKAIFNHVVVNKLKTSNIYCFYFIKATTLYKKFPTYRKFLLVQRTLHWMVCCAVDSTKNRRNELTNKNVWFMRCTCRFRPGFGSLNLIMNVCWSEEEEKGMTWNRWHDNLMHLLTKDC